MSEEELKNVVEAALLAAGRPLRIDDVLQLFEGSGVSPERKEVREALAGLAQDWEGRALELVEVSSGFRLQVRKDFSIWMGRLWADRPPRYSRALMETLALIAYRQPVTRGEIEDVRGVGVSPNITRTLLEREWIRVIGHKETPGRPALFGTTTTFLNDFGLKALDELPPLSEIRDLDKIPGDLFAEVPMVEIGPGSDDDPGLQDDAEISTEIAQGRTANEDEPLPETEETSTD